jgi:acetoin utilization protein AcuB
MNARCPQCGARLPQGVPSWVRRLSVGHVMTRDPATLGPEDSLMRAIELMRRRGIRRIPIVLGGSLVGLLAEGDLKRAQPSTLSASEEEFLRVMESTTISRIMIGEPISVSEDTPLLEAARTLQTTKFGALPVLNGDRLVGILTDSDLLGCLADLLEQGG